VSSVATFRTATGSVGRAGDAEAGDDGALGSLGREGMVVLAAEICMAVDKLVFGFGRENLSEDLRDHEDYLLEFEFWLGNALFKAVIWFCRSDDICSICTNLASSEARC